MRIRQLSINPIVFQNREKILETFEHRHRYHQSRSKVRKVFGTVKGTLLWFFLLAAVIVSSGVVSSEKTFANGVTEDSHQYQVLPPPNPREEIAMKDVFFDFNSFNIKESAKAVLKENAEVLKSNPDVVVFIQGYCDSRENTDEYLGFKRAYAVSDYIVKEGVDQRRVNSVDKCDESYVGLTGDESPWRLDRFVHIIPFKTRQRAIDVAIY
jgi:outer membrane protein OmpA-like peptidoglycan-associated protein